MVHPGLIEYPWGTLYEDTFGIFVYPDESIVNLGQQYNAQYIVTEQRFAFNRALRVGSISFEVIYPDRPDDNQFIVYEVSGPSESD